MAIKSKSPKEISREDRMSFPTIKRRISLPSIVVGEEFLISPGHLMGALFDGKTIKHPLLVTREGKTFQPAYHKVQRTVDDRPTYITADEIKNYEFLSQPLVAKALAQQHGWLYFAPGQFIDRGDMNRGTVAQRKTLRQTLGDALTASLINPRSTSNFSTSSLHANYVANLATFGQELAALDNEISISRNFPEHDIVVMGKIGGKLKRKVSENIEVPVSYSAAINLRGSRDEVEQKTELEIDHRSLIYILENNLDEQAIDSVSKAFVNLHEERLQRSNYGFSVINVRGISDVQDAFQYALQLTLPSSPEMYGRHLERMAGDMDHFTGSFLKGLAFEKNRLEQARKERAVNLRAVMGI